MVRLLRGVLAVVGLLVGLFLGLTGLATHPPVAEALVHAHTYDNQHHVEATPHASTERGPPEAESSGTVNVAVDVRSQGASARSDSVVPTSDYGYEDPAWFVQAARGIRSTEGRSGSATRALVGAERSGVAVNTARLESRVSEVHGALDPIAQTRRTTAALGTREGTTVIGGGVRDLSPSQRALLEEGEMMAGGPGHAEVTTVLGARGAGLTPQEIATSWDICPACQIFLRNEGATLTGPRSAKW